MGREFMVLAMILATFRGIHRAGISEGCQLLKAHVLLQSSPSSHLQSSLLCPVPRLPQMPNISAAQFIMTLSMLGW